ncbi:MAG: thioredoxin [Clostridia bacterium]|nr:thioredoxin [Clostridia bacterium]
MEVVLLNKENFKEEVIEKKGKVLVDFFAVWCGPCKMLAPVLEEFAKKREDIEVKKLNVDEMVESAIEYGVNVIPTLILFENGVEKKRSVGFIKEDELNDLVK